MNQVLLIVIISIIGPLIGSLLGVLRKPSELVMQNMLSFAAGVMLTISFLQLIPESIAMSSTAVSVGGVLIGALVMYILDKSIPHIHPELCAQEQGCNLKKTSIYLIFGIFLHNFPEGIAIAAGLSSNVQLSVTIAFAIAIHNIPEGICTSAPYYFSTKKRLKAFLLSASTVIPLLFGIFLGYFIFTNIPTRIIGLIIGATAGIMIYISADELIPSSCRCKNHTAIFSLIMGVIFVILVNGF